MSPANNKSSSGGFAFSNNIASSAIMGSAIKYNSRTTTTKVETDSVTYERQPSVHEKISSCGQSISININTNKD